MIVMNQSSFDTFAPDLAHDCLLLVNSSMCKIPRRLLKAAVSIPATDIANQIGDTRTANFIMLGAYLARKPLVSPDHIEKGIEDVFAGKSHSLININIRAFRAGLQS